MAPIKLEDTMKERLEERRLEPTSAAWERISGKLEVAQETKKNKRVLWMSIAASFVGGLIIAVLFFQNTSINEAPSIVTTPETDVDTQVIEDAKRTPQSNKEQIIVDQIAEVTPDQNSFSKNDDVVSMANNSSKQSTQSKVVKKKENISIVQKEMIASQNKKEVKESIAIVNETIDTKEEVLIENASSQFDTAISNKVNEIVAQVEHKSSVSDKELDALLKDAQREIISTQIFNKKTNKVDANALLLDVEAEVDPASFREKIFDALKDGFEKARTAVADRNN